MLAVPLFVALVFNLHVRHSFPITVTYVNTLFVRNGIIALRGTAYVVSVAVRYVVVADVIPSGVGCEIPYVSINRAPRGVNVAVKDFAKRVYARTAGACNPNRRVDAVLFVVNETKFHRSCTVYYEHYFIEFGMNFL